MHMNTHQVQKMPVHTHTHESVSARRGDARNGKKKASSPTRRHTTLEKSKKDVRTKKKNVFFAGKGHTWIRTYHPN